MRGGVGTIPLMILVSVLAVATIPTPTAEAQSEPVATTSVSLTGNAYVPPDIIVLKGSKVTWTNKDSTVHTVTSEAGGANRDSLEEAFAPAAASAAAVQDYTFNNVGVYKYYCRVHASMKGSVTVVEKFDTSKVPIVNITADDTDTFNPQMVNINLTQTLNWNNPGTHLHDVTFENASVGALGDLKGGGSVSYKFAAEGTYAYRCKYHSTDFKRGMVGFAAVGANASLPVLVYIISPEAGATVNDTITIAGTANRGFSKAPVTAIEVSFDGLGEWKAATGIESWTFEWDTTRMADGPHEILARAVSDGNELGRANMTVQVDNTQGGGTGPGSEDIPTPSGSGSPGPAFLLVVAALALVALRRRK